MPCELVVCMLVCFLMTASGAFALSDSEYKALLQSSPEYRQAETELAAAWKHAYQSVKSVEGMAYRELRDNQRDWLATARDEEAQGYIARGMDRGQAYARVTRDRTAYLNSFVR
ncbi:MAG: DUF1311 domain-containing protein [Desulfovibrio sp.]|nr:DUF1311 domain-containing protein [Desulfovibrio sp.]